MFAAVWVLFWLALMQARRCTSGRQGCGWGGGGQVCLLRFCCLLLMAVVFGVRACVFALMNGEALCAVFGLPLAHSAGAVDDGCVAMLAWVLLVCVCVCAGDRRSALCCIFIRCWVLWRMGSGCVFLWVVWVVRMATGGQMSAGSSRGGLVGVLCCVVHVSRLLVGVVGGV